MKAKTLGMRYEEGDFAVSQGVKGGGVDGRSYYKGGSRHMQQGFGWEKVVTPSKLILEVEYDGKYAELWVGGYFKTNLGRLTKKRRQKLRDAMPNKIGVHKAENVFLYADESDLYEWQIAAGL